MSYSLETILTSAPKTIEFNEISFDSSLDRSHPNKMLFKGILLFLDQPSQQPPHGSEGHQIEVPKEAAEHALKSLVGMGINYKPDLEGHDPKKKIGVISKAWIEGNKVEVEGIIWPKDFPEAVRALRANRGDLGMSMELGNVYVTDQDADVWVLEKFHFTGATVLKKESAAYQHTSLAASAVSRVAHAAAAAAWGNPKGGKEPMGNGTVKKTKDQSQVLARAIAAGVESAFSSGPVKAMTKALEQVNATNGEVLKFVKEVGEQNKAVLAVLSASKKKEPPDDNDPVELDVDNLLAATHDASSTSSASGSSSAMRAADSSASGSMSTSAMAARDDDDATSSDPTATDPTATASDQRAAADPTAVDDDDPQVPDNRIVNKKASEHARTQAKSGATGQLTPGGGDGGVSAAKDRKNGALVVTAATAKLVRNLSAQLEEQRNENRKLKNHVRKIEAQLENYADRIDRRTLSPEVLNLLEKTGHNPRELMASGTKLTVGQVDEMFLKSGLSLDPTTKIALKNQLLQNGIMESGIVNRQYMM